MTSGLLWLNKKTEERAFDNPELNFLILKVDQISW
jgi:hypothetical protein